MTISLLVISGAVLAYLLGSVNFALIISSLYIKRDIREMGSGNAGMTNVMRNVGVFPGILTFVLDAAKGLAACLIGRYVIFSAIYGMTGSVAFLPIYGAYFCGILCQIGHIFPVFFKFKGGKAVSVTAGVMMACSWRAFLVGISLFLILFIITRIVSVGSICAVCVIPFSVLFFGVSPYRWIEAVFSALLAVIVLIMHIPNIKRIIKGEEKQLHVKR